MKAYIVFPFAANPIEYNDEIINYYKNNNIPHKIVYSNYSKFEFGEGMNAKQQSIINKNHYFIFDDIIMYANNAAALSIRIPSISNSYTKCSIKHIFELYKNNIPFDLGMYKFTFQMDDLKYNIITNLVYKFRYTDDGELNIYVQDSEITPKKLSNYDKKQIKLFKIMESI